MLTSSLIWALWYGLDVTTCMFHSRWLFKLYFHPFIRTALMRPRRPKQYRLHLNVFSSDDFNNLIEINVWLEYTCIIGILQVSFTAGFLKVPIHQHCVLEGAAFCNTVENPPCCFEGGSHCSCLGISLQEAKDSTIMDCDCLLPCPYRSSRIYFIIPNNNFQHPCSHYHLRVFMCCKLDKCLYL